jgi:hypothetical protein
MIKKTFVILASAALAACGGGGSDSSSSKSVVETPPDVPEMLTLEQAENNQKAYGLSFEPDSLRSDFESSAIDVSVEGNSLVIAAGEIDRELLGRIDIMVQGKVEAYAVVSITNTSAQDEVAKAKAFDEQKQDLLAFSEAEKLFRHYVDAGYLAQELTNSEKESLLAAFKDGGVLTYQQAASAINDVYAASKAYTGGAISEHELGNVIASAEVALDGHSSHVQKMFGDLKSVFPRVPDFSQARFVFNPEEQVYSMFVGNASFGSFTEDGSFVFSPEYSDLTGFSFKNETHFFCPF